MKIFLGIKEFSCSLNYQYSLIYNYVYKYIVKDVKDADIIIVPCTCCCTEKMVMYSLSYIESLYLQNKDAKILVTGCLTRNFKNPQYRQNITNYFQKRNIKVYPNIETGKLLQDILEQEYDYRPDNFGYGYIDSKNSEGVLYLSTGCLNNCSFCKSTYQEMPLKSADLELVKDFIDVVDEEKLTDITLKGTNISQYGYDLDGEYKLPEIISYINSKRNIKNVNLVGFTFKDAIQNNFKKIILDCNKNFMINGSLESGSSRLLKLIRKGFSADEFLEFMDGLDNILWSLAIIAGFPTENLNDVKQTLNVLKQIKKLKVQICQYTNSRIINSNNYEQLSPDIIEQHTRIYQKVLKKRNVPNKIVRSY